MQTALITLILHYRYWILFPLACFEGPLLSIVIGFLVGLGYFNPFAAYALLVMGDLVPDTIYYYIGRRGKKASLIEKYGSKIGFGPERFQIVENLWHKHPGKTMWTSKLAYGFSTAFLIFCGLSGLPPRLFYWYAIPVTLSQYLILMSLGYFFGNSYTLISSAFNGFEVAVAAVILIGALYYGVTIYMRKRLVAEEKEEEREENPTAETP